MTTTPGERSTAPPDPAADPRGPAAGSASCTPGTSDTHALVSRALAGSAEAFGELVAPFEGPLYRFLSMRTGNAADAEELAQEALLRAWTHLARFDPARPFGPWLYTIAYRLASSLHRSRGRRPTTALPDELHDQAPGPSQASQASEQRGRLWELAANVLSPEQTSALWLRYAEDLAPAEIGRVLGRPGPAVRVLLHRARRVLARHLEQPERASWSPALNGPHARPQAELPR